LANVPLLRAVALQLGKKYRPLEIPETVTPSLVNNSKDVALGIRLAAIVATWAEAFRRQATARTVEDPNFIPEGYVLVESQRRSVVKAHELGKLAKEFIPPMHQHLVDALFDVPIGELEKLVSTWAARGEKEKTVEALERVLSPTGQSKWASRFHSSDRIGCRKRPTRKSPKTDFMNNTQMQPIRLRPINHVAFVIDESGSMQRHTSAVVRVFDEQIKTLASQSVKMEQETRVSLYLFNSRKGVTCIAYDCDVLRLPSLKGQYRADGGTPLVHATLTSIMELAQTPELHADHAFLLYVITDGEENRNGSGGFQTSIATTTL